MDEKDQGVVDLPEVSGDKYLPLGDLHQELLESALTTGEIDDALQQLGGVSLSATDADDLLIEEVSSGEMAGDRDLYFDNDEELDLSAGVDGKSSDPVRMYLRQMSNVPLLKREQEVALAKRIERGQSKMTYPPN